MTVFFHVHVNLVWHSTNEIIDQGSSHYLPHGRGQCKSENCVQQYGIYKRTEYYIFNL